MRTLTNVSSNLKKVSLYSLSAILSLAAIAGAVLPGRASAAGSLQSVMVRFDRMQISQQTTGTVCAKPASVGTEVSVAVVFPTGYTLGAAGTFTVNTTNLNWPAGGTAWPSIATASNVTTQTVTFPSGDLTVGTLYCFNWINNAAVKQPSSASGNLAGSVTTQATGPVAIDTLSFTTQSLTSDQIAVSASVSQSFTFALANTTDTLGSLSTGSVTSSPTPATATVNTNAGTGWMVWAQDANGGLKSNATSHTIASLTPGSASTVSIGSEGTNLGITSSQTGGTGTISLGNFDGTTAAHGSGLDTTLRPIATSNGTANGAVLTLKNNVGIASTTQAAADYADTITVVGAGLF